MKAIAIKNSLFIPIPIPFIIALSKLYTSFLTIKGVYQIYKLEYSGKTENFRK